MNAVVKTKEYISEGDVMQVVLSQRLSKKFDGDPLKMYEVLRDLNPSPYMYFLCMEDFQIIGSLRDSFAVRHESRDPKTVLGRATELSFLCAEIRQVLQN